MGRVPKLSYHGTQREYILLDIVNGDKISLKIVHGVMMSIGWIIIHIGTIYVSLYKEAGESKTIVHVVLQTIGVLFILISAIIIVSSVGDHLNTPNFHSYFGLGTLVLMLFQSVLGFSTFRLMLTNEGEKKPLRRTLRRIHQIVGWLLMFLSFATIGLGILTLFDQFLSFWTGIYFGGVASIIILILLVALSRLFCNSSYKKLLNSLQNEEDGIVY